MMSDLHASTAAGERGPADHSIRDQIIEAAGVHFGHYGYGKTTVADLGRAIGFSKAYIYKFFDSKQAIGEAICRRCLDTIVSAARATVADKASATDKLRGLFKIIPPSILQIASNDKHIYEIASYSCAEHWPSAMSYIEDISSILSEIIKKGRLTREFERKTPIDETVRAIMLVFQPLINPAMLRYNLKAVPEEVNAVVNLVLRSLAP